LTHGNAALQQKGADLIDDDSALTDQPLTHPVHRLQIELLAEHGRTIPLPDLNGPLLLRCTAPTCYTRHGRSRCSGANSLALLDGDAASPFALAARKDGLGEEPCARSVLFCSVSQ
jgi:hypothetical protein